MLYARHINKINSDNIARWRLEPTSYSCMHCCASAWDRKCWSRHSDSSSLWLCSTKPRDLHVAVCHPGVTRMGHFVRTKSLPFSLNDIREMTSQCEECQQIKPHFVRSNDARLIKATQVFERLNLDFKGSLTSASSNKYFLAVVDEYSRFPFAFPCSDMTKKNGHSVFDATVFDFWNVLVHSF